MVAESGALVALKAACQAENGAGEPCRATPQLNSGYCFWHDPETAEDAQNARRLAQEPSTERARMLLKIGECHRRLAEADECGRKDTPTWSD